MSDTHVHASPSLSPLNLRCELGEYNYTWVCHIHFPGPHRVLTSLSPPLDRHAASANSERSHGIKGSLVSNKYKEIQSYRLVSIFESRVLADSLPESKMDAVVEAVGCGRTHYSTSASHHPAGSLSSVDRTVHCNYRSNDICGSILRQNIFMSLKTILFIFFSCEYLVFYDARPVEHWIFLHSELMCI